MFSLWNHLRGGIVSLKCAICENRFIPSINHPRQATCSRKCSRILSRRKHKAAENRRYRNNRFFGGNKYVAMERDHHTCQNCGSKEDLLVHHKDGYGKGHPKHRKNNSLDNLVTLCSICHLELHQEGVWDKIEKEEQ